MHKTLTFVEFERSYGRQHYPSFLFIFHNMSLLVKDTSYHTKGKPMFFIIYDFVFVVKRFIIQLVGIS